jgi:hypothetical protein
MTYVPIKRGKSYIRPTQQIKKGNKFDSVPFCRFYILANMHVRHARVYKKLFQTELKC